MKMKHILAPLLLVVLSLNAAESSWENATPPATEYDWLEFTSGEWIKGEFKGIYSGEVSFDSDQLDLLEFDLDDVKQIITKDVATINLEDKISLELKVPGLPKSDVIEGKVHYIDGKMQIVKKDGTEMTLEMNEIASMAGGEDKEANYWDASIFVGLDVMSGNSEQRTLTTKAHVQRRTSETRFIADYLGTYTNVAQQTTDPSTGITTSDTVTTANSNRASTSFDIYATAHLYFRVPFVSFLRDPFQNIARNYTTTVGIGYDILYTPATNWSVTVGPGYEYKRFYAVDVNSSETANTALIFLDTQFDTEVTDNIDFIVNYNMKILNEESGTYIHHMEVSLETELVPDLDFDVSVFWDRTDTPAAFADGTVPESNDFKTMIALGYSY